MFASFKTTAAMAGAAACLLSRVALAAPQPFSFHSVEFMDRDQRLPAAQAFVAGNLTPGMPMDGAVMVLRRAGAYCRKPQGGVVSCIHSSMQRHPGQDLQDVTWTVVLTSTPSNTLAAATVSREVAGD